MPDAEFLHAVACVDRLATVKVIWIANTHKVLASVFFRTFWRDRFGVLFNQLCSKQEITQRIDIQVY